MLIDPSGGAKLTDVTVEAFLELLSNRVFMWPYPTRLTNLLAAAHRNSIHDVLVFDTARVVEIYSEESLRLPGMNTGATIFPSPPWCRYIHDAGANVRGQAAK